MTVKDMVVLKKYTRYCDGCGKIIMERVPVLDGPPRIFRCQRIGCHAIMELSGYNFPFDNEYWILWRKKQT